MVRKEPKRFFPSFSCTIRIFPLSLQLFINPLNPIAYGTYQKCGQQGPPWRCRAGHLLHTGSRQIVRQSRNNSNYGESASRSVAQQTRRVMWGNLVNTYQLLASFLPLAFGKLSPGQSSFTRFMQINANVNPFPLTKDHAARQMIVPRGYFVSDGILPSVEVYESEENNVAFETDIFCMSVTAQTTVGQFSQSLISANGFKDGDNIAMIRIFSDTTSGIPALAEADYNEFTLDASSAALLSSLQLTKFWDFGLGDIAAKDVENLVACAFIHTRLVGSKLLVSRQQICVRQSVEEQCTTLLSGGYTRRAMESYGINADALITPSGRNLIY